MTRLPSSKAPRPRVSRQAIFRRGVTDLGAERRESGFDPAAASSVPKGFSITRTARPQWTDDLQALTFGLYEPRRPRQHRRRTEAETTADAPASNPAPPAPDAAAADDRVDLVLWPKGIRACSPTAEVQETRDRAYSYARNTACSRKILCAWRRRDADGDGQLEAEQIGLRHRRPTDYELMGSLDCRRHEDRLYRGSRDSARKLAIKRLRYFPALSPDGSRSCITSTAITSLFAGDR